MAYCHKREVGCYIVVKKTPGEFAHRHHEVVKLYLIEAIIDSCKKKKKLSCRVLESVLVFCKMHLQPNF